jgi:hypothetical protein
VNLHLTAGTFPNAKHCDQADSTSQALAWINLAPGEPGIISFYRQKAARKKHGEWRADCRSIAWESC